MFSLQRQDGGNNHSRELLAFLSSNGVSDAQLTQVERVADETSLSGEAITGVVVGSILAAGAAVGIAAFLLVRHRKKGLNHEEVVMA